MGNYKNFKMVAYFITQAAQLITEEKLRESIEFFRRYVEPDKVYLEPFRGEPASKDQLIMVKRVLEEYGIEVAGGITTIIPNLSKEDEKRQRLFNTFCYCNEPMRNKLKEMVEYTASLFDEFIIDDFFFTQCMCEDCQREKGSRSWEAFRLEKMAEISKNLVLGPAKAVNPKIKVTVKFPNWMESYQETGYNVKDQKDLFDMIYTGTETRHASQTDQHIPRYLSYSLMRYMENVAPGRNGGGWFDAYECYPMDAFLEQGYLTAFSKPREVMLFCWPLLYNNKLATPLAFQMHRIDNILSKAGEPVGMPVYLPYNAQGEDHLEDYLGMLAIPFEPTPEFPMEAKSLFLTAAAVKDGNIACKLKDYLNNGGKAIITNGFVTACENNGIDLTEFTSVRIRNRRIEANEYHILPADGSRMAHTTACTPVTFPILEHRNNASWSLVNAGSGAHHASIMLRETYGRGQLYIITVPDNYAEIKKLPREVLTRLRCLFDISGLYLVCDGEVSLFTYDNNTFGVYSYACDGCRAQDIEIHIAGKDAKSLRYMEDDLNSCPRIIEPYYVTNDETVFRFRQSPGDFDFFTVNSN